MPGIKALAGVARAPFLLLPLTLAAVGGAAALYDGTFSWSTTALALFGLVALHMAVNIFNEWSDMRTGIDLATERTPFSGGSGTLPAGEMTVRGAFVFGIVCAGIGLAVGLWFYARLGTVLVPILVVGAVCVLAYSDLLARLGIGELAAGLGLGGLAVVGTTLVNTGEISRTAVAAGIPATLMTFNLLLLNEFPDEKADRIGGRRHLVILLGRRGAALVYAAAAIGTPMSIMVSVIAGALPPSCLVAALPSLLLAKPLRWAFGDPSQAVPVPALGANVVWNLATNTVMAAALIAVVFLN
jgi:1,4-dihydroxy-2-naphthoate octaprenyltransferase